MRAYAYQISTERQTFPVICTWRISGLCKSGSKVVSTENVRIALVTKEP